MATKNYRVPGYEFIVALVFDQGPEFAQKRGYVRGCVLEVCRGEKGQLLLSRRGGFGS